MAGGVRVRHRHVIAAVVTASAVLVASASAMAKEEAPTAGVYVNGGDVTITAGNTTRTEGGGGGGPGQGQSSGGAAAPQGTPDPFCPDVNNVGFICDYATPADLVPLAPVPVVDPRVLAVQALRSLSLPAPDIRLSPPPPKDQLVNLATWMWVEPGTWGARSTSVSVPGVTVSVSAQPQRVVWTMGNGDSLACNGPGTPYDTTKPETAQRSDCTYTYRRSSAGQPHERYLLSATVEWRATWSVVGAPGGGALPGIRRSASLPVRVAEIQSLIIGAG